MEKALIMFHFRLFVPIIASFWHWCVILSLIRQLTIYFNDLFSICQQQSARKFIVMALNNSTVSPFLIYPHVNDVAGAL